MTSLRPLKSTGIGIKTVYNNANIDYVKKRPQSAKINK